VLDEIVEAAKLLCRGEHAQLYLAEGELFRILSQSSDLHAAYDYAREHPHARDRTTVVGRVGLTREVEQIPDVLEDPDYDYGAQDVVGYRALLGVPIAKEGNLIGVIAVARDSPGQFAADDVELVKTFADEAAKNLDRPLQLNETKYFLFYSDLPPQDARNWAGLLDRMYGRLAELFGVEKGRNLWRGKALVFVFSKPEDYRRFQLQSHKTDPKDSAGMCHSFGNGFVHIAFYRQPQEMQFAHVLVHESVHGFLHRYRSHIDIPSWANEGLAEVIAAELVPRAPEARSRRSRATESLRQRKGVGDNFFTAAQIEAWQYPIAENMCAFMIQQNKRGYVDFINGIKDGLSVEEALDKKYGAGEARIVPVFINSMGVKNK